MFYGKEVDPFYKGKAWRRARAAALERDHYICQDCLTAKRSGERIRARTATMVHHIKPREERPDLELDMDNLISLCDPCHNKRHPEKGQTLRSKDEHPHQGVRIIKV